MYEGKETMGGMDQDGLRFEGNCTLQLPKSSTHCTDCFSTIAAFQNKVSPHLEVSRHSVCVTFHAPAANGITSCRGVAHAAQLTSALHTGGVFCALAAERASFHGARVHPAQSAQWSGHL